MGSTQGTPQGGVNLAQRKPQPLLGEKTKKTKKKKNGRWRIGKSELSGRQRKTGKGDQKKKTSPPRERNGAENAPEQKTKMGKCARGGGGQDQGPPRQKEDEPWKKGEKLKRLRQPRGPRRGGKSFHRPQRGVNAGKG